MKAIYSKQELQELSKAEFARLGVNKLYATSDGQFFLLQNRALLHAAGRNVYELSNDGEVAGGDDSISIEQLTLKVKDMKDAEDLRMLLHKEVGGPNRAAAVHLITTKLDEVAGGEPGDEIKGNKEVDLGKGDELPSLVPDTTTVKPPVADTKKAAQKKAAPAKPKTIATKKTAKKK